MSANESRKGDAAAKQSDLMLWIAAGAIAAVGAAWLAISKPWSDGPQRTVNAAASAPAPASREPVELALAVPAPDGTQSGISQTLDNPLRMAQLAFDAGMLVEPEEYSAWTLYAQVLESEPDNGAAREGLTQVADELVRRGATALEQGRFDDVRRTTERVLAMLPQHAAAKDLAAKLWPATAVAGPVEAEALKPELDVRQAPPPVETIEPVRAAPAPAPARDLVAEANAAFQDAMNGSLLLAPAGQSAKHFLDELIALAPNHESTELASRRLSDELLSRSQQSLEALDIEAARVWIDEAERIGIDPRGVRAARDDLTNQLIELESAKPVPASALQIANYVVPEYPARALDRGLEGWVDLEFTIGTDGTTRDVTVADASHEVFFRREAVEAVEAWTFEPRVFMDRTIEQRTYTRIRFVQ